MTKHKSRINKDPKFRNAFHEMCMAVGVDPLRSNKGFLADMIGSGQFYSELGVQVLTICLTTREMNGGIIDVNEVITILEKQGRSGVGMEDISRAMRDLEILGGGVKIKRAGNKMLIISVPEELNSDQSLILEFASEQVPAGQLTEEDIITKFNWTPQRIELVLNFFIREGLVWIDDGTAKGVKGRKYWFPSIALAGS